MQETRPDPHALHPKAKIAPTTTIRISMKSPVARRSTKRAIIWLKIITMAIPKKLR